MKNERYTKKEADAIIKEVRNLSYKLSYALDNKTWTNYWSNLVDEEYKDEIKHRKCAPDDVYWVCSSKDAARLLCCQSVIKAVLALENYIPTVDDYIHIKTTRFMAYCLAVNFAEDIINCFDDVDIDVILKADYCRFN